MHDTIHSHAISLSLYSVTMYQCNVHVLTALPLHVLVPSLGFSAIPDPVHWEWRAVCGERGDVREGRGGGEGGEGGGGGGGGGGGVREGKGERGEKRGYEGGKGRERYVGEESSLQQPNQIYNMHN